MLARRAVPRWASPGVPVTAVILLAHGVVMLLNPESFRGPTYVAVFEWSRWSRPVVWGWVMLTVGVLGLTLVRPWVAAAVAGIAATWGGFMLVAVLQGRSGSYVGWMWAVGCGIGTAWGSVRRGSRL